MGRITGPVCRLCRRDGLKLFLKGSRCDSPKCAFERRPTPPGVQQKRRSKPTDYGLRLREKQKLKHYYGVLERQFRTYFARAERGKGNTGETLLSLLERRLDNVVHRLGFAASRAAARQMVMHGHITINGRRVDVPSYLVRQAICCGSRIVRRACSSPMRLWRIFVARCPTSCRVATVRFPRAVSTGFLPPRMFRFRCRPT